MYIKIIDTDWRDCHTHTLTYRVGEVTMAPDWDPHPDCGHGIHYSASLCTALSNTAHNNAGRLVEVEPVGDVVNLVDKEKAQGVRVLRTLTCAEFVATITPDDADGWNRRLRAARVGLETLDPHDADELNRMLRAAATEQWDTVFRTVE